MSPSDKFLPEIQILLMVLMDIRRCYYSSVCLFHNLFIRSADSFAVVTISSKKRPIQHLIGRKMAGRGEYYKNKYGGGGRGRGRGGRGGGGGGDVRGGRGRGGGRGESRSNAVNQGGSFQDFLNLLDNLDGKSYGGYHGIESTTQGWSHDNFVLRIGRAQSDPFAAPTRCQVKVSSAFCRLPPSLYSNKIRSVALSDYIHRAMYAHAKEMGVDASLDGQGWSGPKGGDIQLLPPCQHVLEQSAVVVNSDGTVVTQLTVNLPARGRTILGRAAKEIFGQTLTTLLHKSLNYASLNSTRVESHVNSIEDQVWLQSQLESHGIVAFVRDGAILPRASGVDDHPLKGGLPFESPESMRVSYQLPSTGVTISGMAFRKGISLICGGGFHGKSTLLEALQVGVYPKVPGDGREFVVTTPFAVKIRAEDGRCITAVDISPFISNLPFGKETTCFSTLDASGSTSQASNILEVSSFNHRRNRIFAVYDFSISTTVQN
jgi:predicted ABC-class ATPase